MKTIAFPLALPRWVYIALAMLLAGIGLASSFVTMEFFILGLERAEPDTLAKEALIAAGVLMILTELAAFGLSALLPASQLKALRWRLMACGLMLLTFEAATIYVTQVTLVKSSEATASAATTRIADLRASIDSRRASAAGLRQNAAQQSISIFAASRALGAVSLREALDIDKDIEPMAKDLAKLQAGKTATLTDVLGETGMLIYSVSRALLISVMGLVMFGAAGSLMRCAFAAGTTGVPGTAAVPDAPDVPVLTFKRAETVSPKEIYYPSKAFIAAGLPFVAMAAPMVHAAPHVPVVSSSSVPVQGQDEGTAARTTRVRKSTAITDGKKQDTGTEGKSAGRYERVKAGVLAGQIKPSVRGIQAAEGGGKEVVSRYIKKLAEDNVIEREGRGWRLNEA